MAPTLYGITRVEGHSEEAIAVLELDARDLSPPPPGVQRILRFSHWSLLADELAEHRDRENLLLETCRAQGAIAATVSVPPRLQFLDQLEERIRSLRETAGHRGLDIFFDFGKGGPPSWIDLAHCVSDPLWFRGQTGSRYWRIHGWHEERWIRRYSRDDLRFLIELARERRPEFILLGHSQRAPQLKELLQELSTYARNNQDAAVSPLTPG